MPRFVKSDSVLPGVQTFVSDKSTLNLPTNIGRERDSALPAGSSATPRTTPDRTVSKFEFNRPDNDIDERPRTLGVPGQDYGHPYKDDYNMPTRRTMTAWESGPVKPKRQRNQHVKNYLEDRRRYLKDRKRRIHKSKMRYENFCKVNTQCLQKRQMQREFPEKYKRRGLSKKSEWSVIPFYFRPFNEQGLILRASDRKVTFILPRLVDSLPTAVFSRVATFDNEAALHKYLDAVVTVPNIDEATVHGVAALYNLDTRRSGLGRMGPAGLKIAVGVLTDRLDARAALNMASRRRATGDVIMFDRGPPNDDVNKPGYNLGYDITGPNTAVKTVDEKLGVPSGQGMPNTHTDNVPAASPRVTPNGQGQFFSGETTYLQASTRFKIAVLMQAIREKVTPDLSAKARPIKPRLHRVDQKNGIYTFMVPSSKDQPYKVKLKPIRKGVTTDIQKLDVQVSCNCPYFQWQGPEHWAKSNGFLFGKPVGTASRPTVKDPKGKHWACKHILAVFNMVKRHGYRLEPVSSVK